MFLFFFTLHPRQLAVINSECIFEAINRNHHEMPLGVSVKVEVSSPEATQAVMQLTQASQTHQLWRQTWSNSCPAVSNTIRWDASEDVSLKTTGSGATNPE